MRQLNDLINNQIRQIDGIKKTITLTGASSLKNIKI